MFRRNLLQPAGGGGIVLVFKIELSQTPGRGIKLGSQAGGLEKIPHLELAAGSAQAAQIILQSAHRRGLHPLQERLAAVREARVESAKNLPRQRPLNVEQLRERTLLLQRRREAQTAQVEEPRPAAEAVLSKLKPAHHYPVGSQLLAQPHQAGAGKWAGGRQSQPFQRCQTLGAADESEPIARQPVRQNFCKTFAYPLQVGLTADVVKRRHQQSLRRSRANGHKREENHRTKK